MSNVFGVKEGVNNTGIPFLGEFKTQGGCEQACTALSNCTQCQDLGTRCSPGTIASLSPAIASQLPPFSPTIRHDLDPSYHT